MDEEIKYLEFRGYSTHYTGNRMVTMAKWIEGNTVYATLYESKPNIVKLECFSGRFKISSGDFALNHPKFEESYEQPLVRMMETV